MTIKNAFFALMLLAIPFGACKRHDDAGNALDCSADPVPPRAWLMGGFILPTGFSPNGDGLNDWLGPIVSDSQAVRSMSFRISDASGRILYTITKPTDHWDGHEAINKTYPAGAYNVDFDVVLNGKGVTDDSTVSGHTCVWLFGISKSDPGSVYASSDPALIHRIVFGDQIDEQILAYPYPTQENISLKP